MRKIGAMTYKHQMNLLMRLREKLISSRDQSSAAYEEMAG